MRITILALIGTSAVTGLAAPPGDPPCANGQPPQAGRICGPCDSVYQGYRCEPQMTQNWGTNSPWFSAKSSIPVDIPKDCSLTMVQVLSRHGSRYPTKKKSAHYKQVVAKVQSTAKKFPGNYKFIKTYRYNLGAADLTTFGEQQMVNSGIKFFKRYSSLAKNTEPFFRSAGGERVVISGLNFTQGFHSAKQAETVDRSYPYPMLIIPEKAGQNNTLAHDGCPAFENGPNYGKTERERWLGQFIPPITKRINKDLGTTLDNNDVFALMDMCPYTSANNPAGKISEWCYLFAPKEWLSYTFYFTLSKYYGFGPGNPLGPTQGVGFTNELIARLTRTPVRDTTSTNATLNANAATFPLDRKLYVDFSHDNDMVAIMFALNLYPSLPAPKFATTRRDPNAFDARTATPFAARVYVEKMVCDSRRKWGRGELVRVLVNDRVVPLRGCGADKLQKYGKLGFCELGRFVDSLAFARRGGEWNRCFTKP